MSIDVDLSKFVLSDYNENTEDQLDYYIDENQCSAGDRAYLYSHADDKLTPLKILHTIRRSSNPKIYDDYDDDVLIDCEEAFGADTSAEFITDDDCYLVWFKYDEVS